MTDYCYRCGHRLIEGDGRECSECNETLCLRCFGGHMRPDECLSCLVDEGLQAYQDAMIDHGGEQ